MFVTGRNKLQSFLKKNVCPVNANFLAGVYIVIHLLKYMLKVAVEFRTKHNDNSQVFVFQDSVSGATYVENL